MYIHQKKHIRCTSAGIRNVKNLQAASCLVSPSSHPCAACMKDTMLAGGLSAQPVPYSHDSLLLGIFVLGKLDLP